MALGGGTFLVQNKVLPGAYINFISAKRGNSTLSDRGYATIALELDWGVDGEIFEITNEDFQKKSFKILGYDFSHEKMKPFRDLFLNLKTLYLYKLNKGVKADNAYATAKFSGVRGNALKVVVKQNVDNEELKEVYLYLDNILVDEQKVSKAAELVDNDFVTWKKEGDLVLTSGANLSTGSNGEVSVSNHQEFLNKIESYNFNILTTDTKDSSIKKLYSSFTKRMRDEVGAKFQLVIHDLKADYEGVINIKNNAELVYWVTGVEASCDVNRSVTNKKYDGEYDIKTDYTQGQLVQSIEDGEFILHKVGKDIRVLSDINSLTTETDEKGEIFKDNQTIRVIDQIANDVANIFNTKYLGIVPNDKSGRISLWNDIVKYHEDLQKIRALENFKPDDIIVEQGDSKKSVLIQNRITVVNAMEQLYMIVKVA